MRWNAYYADLATDEAIRRRLDLEAERWASRHYRVLKELLGNEILSREARVLDVATGSGRFALRLASDFPKLSVEGLDLLPQAVAVANRGKELCGNSNVRFRQGEALNLPNAFPEAEQFDAVYSIGLVQALDPVGVEMLVDSCLRMVKAGGTIVLSFPNGDSPIYRFWKKIAGKNIAKRYGLERSVSSGEVVEAFEQRRCSGIRVEGSDPLYGLTRKKLGWIADDGRVVTYWWSGFVAPLSWALNGPIDALDTLTRGSISRRWGFDVLVRASAPRG